MTAPLPLPVDAAADVVADAREHADYLAWAWPDLVEHRLHGTARPWSEAAGHTPSGVRAARAAAAHAEMLERTGLAPGPGPAPVRVDVLDLLVDVVDATRDVVAALADVLASEGADPPPGASPALDPRPHLVWVSAWLPAAHATDPRTGPWVASRLVGPARAVAVERGDVVPGQVLAALCPWCGGRGPDGLEGTRTLRVAYPEHGSPGDPVIVCTGVGCDPPGLARAGRDSTGRPSWAPASWVWLAQRLEPLPPVATSWRSDAQ